MQQNCKHSDLFVGNSMQCIFEINLKVTLDTTCLKLDLNLFLTLTKCCESLKKTIKTFRTLQSQKLEVALQAQIFQQKINVLTANTVLICSVIMYLIQVNYQYILIILIQNIIYLQLCCHSSVVWKHNEGGDG